MNEYDRQLKMERGRLETTLDIVERQLSTARAGNRRAGAGLTDAKEEMYAQTQQMFPDLSAEADFEGLLNLNQYAQDITIRQTMYDQEQSYLHALARMRAKPYFARIDLAFDGEDAPDEI